MNQSTLAELNRVKCMFQMRALLIAMGVNPDSLQGRHLMAVKEAAIEKGREG